MTLDEYLRQSLHGERRRIARALGVSESTVHRWRRGQSMPARKTIMEIDYQTAGRVSPSDWFDAIANRE